MGHFSMSIPMRFLVKNKWTVAAIPALLIHISIGTVYCWSSFSENLSQEVGVPTSVLGWAFSLAIFFLGMSAAFAGSFVEHNIHKASLIACICFTTGMIGTGLTAQFTQQLGPTASLIMIFLFYGVIMGIGLGIGYITPVKTLMLWFADNKGLGTGISIMGFGLAKAIASPVMNALEVQVGIPAMFYILGAVYFVMMLIGHFLLEKPAGWKEDATASKKPDFSIFKNKQFVGIWFMFYLNITCGLALISYEKSLLKVLGVGIAAISIVQMLTAASNALGRLGYSMVSDFMKDRNTVYKIIFTSSLVVTALVFAFQGINVTTLVILVVAMLLVINAGYGGGFSTLPALLSSRFGMQKISGIHGIALSAWAFAGLTGNQITATVLNATGSYNLVFIILAGLYAVALIISMTLVKRA
ncbi:major facilitator superfamily permease [Bifidobacterium tsurumiense]|uniref:Major facilitator superfamily permease n=2 Tax=Bifidobacterium tsurumiense TaxID=356829 RepID=A0A087EBH6_9BIFI|nr:OFA family MFS transporter [Bifidobacterium tsurumiense]KFJ05127.1 major facilitator superfamily permease [Bifidobacterium tsurumiense]